jgi:hypothetical protein
MYVVTGAIGSCWKMFQSDRRNAYALMLMHERDARAHIYARRRVLVKKNQCTLGGADAGDAKASVSVTSFKEDRS